MLPAPLSILIFGASYGLLPAAKLALAGHQVTIIGRELERQGLTAQGVSVLIPLRHATGEVRLSVKVSTDPKPGQIQVCVPAEICCETFDFVMLAMQEPQYCDPQVATLMHRVAWAGVPCLSLMNWPPPPFLTRLGVPMDTTYEGACSCMDVWRNFEPALFSLTSPDPQAIRTDPKRPGFLKVTLASNFKAAPFDDVPAQELLKSLAKDFATLKPRAPVHLLAHSSVFIPLAKWPMLLTGNYRCLTESGVRTISETVTSELEQSAKIYDSVQVLLARIGMPAKYRVTFEDYCKAARKLLRPSSVARSIDAGAKQVERTDRLVLNLLHMYGLPEEPIAGIVARTDAHLTANR
jgi:hypothetical protein